MSTGGTTSMPLDMALTPELRDYIKQLPLEDLAVFNHRADWLASARAAQRRPAGDWWTIWLILAGRGFGKTRVGAEESLAVAMSEPKRRCLVAAPTSGDVRDTCFEGESGILEIMPKELYKKGCYVRSLHELNLPNGSLIKGIPASEPERFRGPQWHYAWCDELAAWQYLKDAWDMIMFSLRLGPHPRLLATTTPKPLPLLRELIKRIGKDVVMSRGSTYENRANLAPTFFNQVTQYEGTELGRQELHAELLDPEESGIIKRRWFQLWPADKALPRFDFVLPSLDTALTDKQVNDPTASQTWGIFQPAPGMPHAAMLIDAWEERLEFPELIQRCKDEFQTSYGEPSEWLQAQQPLIKSRLGPTLLGDNTEAASGRKPDMMVIENTVAKPVIQVLQRHKLPIIPYNPGNVSKLQRLHMASPIAKSRRLWLPESKVRRGQPRDWCEAVLSQVCAYHGEDTLEHDDHVDAFSQGIRVLQDLGWLTVDPTSLITVLQDPVEPHEERAKNPYAA